jgi:colanic acid biosynthesis glycosyl transferase WcaI
VSEQTGEPTHPRDDRLLLVLSHFYPPDPASVGQHIADACAEMARRGHRVRVITANRGFEDPSQKFPSRETIDGVDVRRVPFSSFGKKSLLHRAASMAGFLVHCLWAVLLTRKVKFILVSTSPPLCGFAAGVAHMLRGIPFLYWVMDLNPDQLIVLGKTTESSITARMSNALQRFILKRAKQVVVLDRFMAERVNRKRDVSDKTTIIPPWPHEDSLESVEHADNWFREREGVQDSFVLMYSGNHGYSTPVGTMLDAAKTLAPENGTTFMFIGGGVRKKEVDERLEREKPENVRSLPYQPMEHLRYSLGAADVHMVAMEEEVVGIIHPCKIYGAMAVGRPILLLGPSPCHASDVLEGEDIGWRVASDDTEGMVRAVREARSLDPERLQEMGRRAKQLVDEKYSKRQLCGAFCDLME